MYLKFTFSCKEMLTHSNHYSNFSSLYPKYCICRKSVYYNLVLTYLFNKILLLINSFAWFYCQTNLTNWEGTKTESTERKRQFGQCYDKYYILINMMTLIIKHTTYLHPKKCVLFHDRTNSKSIEMLGEKHSNIFEF